MWRQCAPTANSMVCLAHTSLPLQQHLNWFSCFATAHCVPNTETDAQTWKMQHVQQQAASS